MLDPFVTESADEFRIFIEYAKCLLALGSDYKTAAATLHMAHLTGMSDPRYVSTLGGMLFLAKSYTEAETMFGEGARRGVFL